jgi:hypothetical protein
MFARREQSEAAEVFDIKVMPCAPGGRQDCETQGRERCANSIVSEPGRERQVVKLWPVEPVGEFG